MNKKLRAQLIASIKRHALPPFSEANLRTMLSELRRLLEGLNEKKNFPTLTLFCDWILHPELSNPRVQEFLAEVDKYYECDVAAAQSVENNLSPLLGNFLSWHSFKAELNTALSNCGIATPAVANKAAWAEFEEVYCKLVGEGRLVYKNKHKPLKHIDSAVVSFQKPQFNPTQISYDPITAPNATEWTFFQGEKEVFRILLTFGSKPAMRDALPPGSWPQTPTRPPG